LLKSDILFLTKTGLLQLEEVLECRIANSYRYKKIPHKEDLSYWKYIGKFESKRWKDPDYNEIIKPTLTHEDLIGVEDR